MQFCDVYGKFIDFSQWIWIPESSAWALCLIFSELLFLVLLGDWRRDPQAPGERRRGARPDDHDREPNRRRGVHLRGQEQERGSRIQRTPTRYWWETAFLCPQSNFIMEDSFGLPFWNNESFSWLSWHVVMTKQLFIDPSILMFFAYSSKFFKGYILSWQEMKGAMIYFIKYVLVQVFVKLL